MLFDHKGYVIPPRGLGFIPTMPSPKRRVEHSASIDTYAVGFSIEQPEDEELISDTDET